MHPVGIGHEVVKWRGASSKKRKVGICRQRDKNNLYTSIIIVDSFGVSRVLDSCCVSSMLWSLNSSDPYTVDC